MSRNINEEFLSVLSQYDGTVDDRRKKYLQDTYGFSNNSALPKMEYEVLGNLGYSGAINDRWSKYLKALGGTGLSSKAELLSSTFYGFYSAGSLSPELVLDFERETYLTDSSATTFSDALTFSRSGSATYVDSTGTLQTAADGEPRIGHHVWNGSEWVNEGLLIESEARTNLVTYSEDFTEAYWAKGFLSVGAVDNSFAVSLTSIQETNNSGKHELYPASGLSLSTATYTATFFLKSDGRDYVRVSLARGSLSFGASVIVNLASGTLGSVQNYGGHTGGVATIQNFGGGVYRVSITTNATAGIYYPAFRLSNDGVVFSYTGDNTKGVYVGGAQLEEGSTPSSYIPTSGSTVTRAGETLTVPAANLPWPEPVVIGDELVTNGTFDTDISGWSADGDGTIAVNSGALQYTGTAAGPTFMTVSTSENLTLTSGAVYRLTFDVVEITPANEMRVQLGGGNNVLVGITTAGSYEAVVVAPSASEPLLFGIVGGLAGETFSIDNISVREIDPLAVSIAMEGTVTYADGGGFNSVEFYDWSLDGNNNIITKIDNDVGVGQVTFVQESGGVIDLVDTASNLYTPGINVPFNIASRHGSAFINGAVDGTALTVNTTPTALPDLSNTDLEIGSDFMGTIKTFRVWADDIGDTGIEEASS